MSGGVQWSGEEREGAVALCSVRAGDGLFGIDTREVREVLGTSAPRRVPLAPRYIAGVLAYRGEVLTTVSLRALLGLEAARGGENCVLVLEDRELGEQFGLLVDGVGGVVSRMRSELRANPETLDARSAAIFAGVYPMEATLLVHLDPSRLRPLQVARCGLFDAMEQSGKSERSDGQCAR
jgi:purine-binding chemotaxis protein CheW